MTKRHLGRVLLMSFALAGAAFAQTPVPLATEAETAPVTTWTRETLWTLPPDAGIADAADAVALDELPEFWRFDEGRAEKATVLLSTNFESGFPSVWTAFRNGGSAADVYWGRSTRRASSGSASAWCAQNGSASPGPGGDVPPNTASWMVSGPFDLSGTSSGRIDFDTWLETEAGFDFLLVAASVDGTNFTALGSDQNTSGWQPVAVDLTQWGSLGDLTGRSAVWFAFLYVSDGSVTYEGAYLDNIVLSTDTGGSGSGPNLVINQIDAGDCPQVQAIVSVLDDAGDPIPGLTEANFTVREDTVEQTFTVDTPGTAGSALAVTLVLDGSGSLSNADITNIQVAGNEFIDLLAPNDQIAVYHFGTNVTRVQGYTTNRGAARSAVNALTNDLGFTSLFDAIVDAANYSTTVGGRRALVVMTDGRNNDSAASQQDAIDAARAAGVPVFTIGFGSADLGVLTAIADQTGGLVFQGADSGDLQTIFQRIGQTLNSQFILTWTTAARDGGVHDVTVQVQTQGQTASRATTYSQAGTPCANAQGPCASGPTTMCLNNDRFRVRVRWNNGGQSGDGSVASCGSDDSGLFWFFDPNNWEMLVKVLDACGVNGNYWVFLAATTNLGYDVTVTDTATGQQRTYSNRAGVAAPAVTDTAAFATCP